MYTIEMGYKTGTLKAAVQYTQEGRKWNPVKTSNSMEATAIKTNKLFVVQTPLQSVSMTCRELADMLSTVLDAYDTLVNLAAENIDAKLYAENILPGEVERFSKPIPNLNFPITMDTLPVLMDYMGQSWRYDTIHNYWFPLNSDLNYAESNTPPTFFIDGGHAEDELVDFKSPATYVHAVADIINCFTSLGTDNKAGVYNYILLEG